MTDKFVKSYKAGRMIKSVCLKDDERVSITSTDKLVADHMLDKWLFFDGLSRQYYENQNDIADALGLRQATVSDSIKKLIRIGLVRAKTKNISGARNSNSYVVKSWTALNPIVHTRYNPKQPMPLKVLIGEQSKEAITVSDDDLDKCVSSGSVISFRQSGISVRSGDIHHIYTPRDSEVRLYAEAVLRKARALAVEPSILES